LAILACSLLQESLRKLQEQQHGVFNQPYVYNDSLLYLCSSVVDSLFAVCFAVCCLI